MIIIILFIILMFFVITNQKSETFYDEFKPDFLSVYSDKLDRYLKSPNTKKILLIGSISQKKLDFLVHFLII